MPYTDKLRETAQQALEVIEGFEVLSDREERVLGRLCDKLRAALAEQQEPIAWGMPQPRKRLTREDIQDAVCDVDLDWHQGWTLDEGALNRYETLCRAIEAAVWGETK